MNNFKNTLIVNTNVEITPETLQSIVLNAKTAAEKNKKGVIKVDTANKLSEIISLFLHKKNFENFAKNIKHYT
ncbi:MAG: hypothetical protein B6I26_02080 [Desulfobacteraceae bacterium 4572_130]|nr:MAG: hypothetical protein B6I26_02080 [Desulfobacteraceae bacterium 4572_130]